MPAVHHPVAPNMKRQQQEGRKALIMNIAFFAVLLVGIVLVPVLGLYFSAAAISLAFVASLCYIYLT
ncbi:MAG: hypothetical protein DDT21_01236 [Syntrophomonadaceae bacterium]|nr:hypothetical protein [Bacillota bacterium]